MTGNGWANFHITKMHRHNDAPHYTLHEVKTFDFVYLILICTEQVMLRSDVLVVTVRRHRLLAYPHGVYWWCTCKYHNKMLGCLWFWTSRSTDRNLPNLVKYSEKIWIMIDRVHSPISGPFPELSNGIWHAYVPHSGATYMPRQLTAIQTLSSLCFWRENEKNRDRA